MSGTEDPRVERVARSIYGLMGGDVEGWDREDDAKRDEYRVFARTSLEALDG